MDNIIIKYLLNEDCWRDWTQEEVDNLNIVFDKSKKKMKEMLDKAPVIEVPYSYFLKGEIFEPYTKNDINNPKKLSTREKSLLKSMKTGKVPYLLAFKNGKKYDVEDGFTRAGLAIPLGIKIKAKLITL